MKHPFVKICLTALLALVLLAGCGTPKKQAELTLDAQSGAILILVPHPDDETLLCGGIIQRALELGLPVTVAIATDGDDQDTDGSIAEMRLNETLAGMKTLGLPEENVVFLGYGDTGSGREYSFLARLYDAADETEVLSAYGGTKTHALPDHPDFHTVRTGQAGDYTRQTFLDDVKALVSQTKPSMIFTSLECDQHCDHAALCQFVLEANPSAKVYGGLTHASAGFESWPDRTADVFSAPEGFELDWQAGLRFPLTETEREVKREAIGAYRSQLTDIARDYLYSFAKTEEIFFLLNG